jgi:hypothetical protein
VGLVDSARLGEVTARWTVGLETTMASTAPDASGAHEVTAPVETLSPAWPPTAAWPVWSSISVTVPPKWTMLPLTATACSP